MSNRFGHRAQGPTAQGPQAQYGPEQEAQEQYGSRPPQGMQDQTGRQPAAQEQYVPRPSRGYEDVREREGAPAYREAPPAKRGVSHGHGAGLSMLTGVLAFLVGLGFQLTHKAPSTSGGSLTRHSQYARVRLGGAARGASATGVRAWL